MEPIKLRQDLTRLGTYRPYRVLAGFMDEPHLQRVAVSAIATMTEEEKRGLREVHVRSRQTASALEQEDLGDVVLSGIPDDHAAHLDRVKASEPFRNIYGQREHRFAMVNGGLLCAFQPHVRLAYEIPPPEATEEILAYCIPEKFAYTVSYIVAQGAGGVRVQASSRSPNFAFEGAQAAQNGVLLRVGPNKNWVQVARFQGRCYLKNGYHRVFSLLQRGITEVPCILFEAKDWADVGVGHTPDFFGEQYLTGMARPPVMKDFLSDAAIEIPLREQVKVLDIRIGVEQFGVPL